MQIFEEIVQKLSEAKIESPRLEAKHMIAEVKQLEIGEISSFTEISQEEQKLLQNMVEQRLQHRPLDKILGHKEFYKYDFLCNNDVLSPRFDTEILVEYAAGLIFKHGFRNVLELGVGSGCVLLSLLADFPDLYGEGIDTSEKALKTALKNAQRLGVEQRVNLMRADWNDDNFEKIFKQKFDIIVSNPPYIPSSEIEKLEAEVRDYDPITALDGGISGFDAYERIAEVAPKMLKCGGYLLLESGYNQANKIVEICEKNSLNKLDIIKDLSGIERCVIMQKTLAK